MQQCILHRKWAKMLYGTRSFIWGLAGFLAVWVPGLTTVMVASWNPHLTRNGYAQFTMAQSKMRWTVLSSLPNSCFSSTWKQMASLSARDKPWLLYPLHTAMWYDFCFYLFDYFLTALQPWHRYWEKQETLWHPCKQHWTDMLLFWTLTGLRYMYCKLQLHVVFFNLNSLVVLSCKISRRSRRSHMYTVHCIYWITQVSCFSRLWHVHVAQVIALTGLSLNFKSPVALLSTPVANVLLYGQILLTKGKFPSSMKGQSIILSCDRCYGLWSLMTPLQVHWHCQRWQLGTDTAEGAFDILIHVAMHVQWYILNYETHTSIQMNNISTSLTMTGKRATCIN